MLFHILLPNALIVAIAVIYLVYHFRKKCTSTCSWVKYLYTMEFALLMLHAICARLAEACAEWLQRQLYNDTHVLRVAFGYATCPDHSLKRIVIDRLDAERRLGITLTDHYSIQPSTSVCGLFICHPDARYFPVGRIDRNQLADYCRRRGITIAEGEQLLSKYIAQ